MTIINTNVNATFAHSALNINARAQTSAMQQLSTGKRINGAKDDAAGLAMSEKMTSQIRGLNMAIRNANDAVSMLQTADGAMIEQTNMLQRMRELAVQAATDTVTVNDKESIDLEYQALLEQIDKIGADTEWDGEPLLDGTGGTSGEYKFQVGANSDQTIDITIDDVSSSGILEDIDGTAVSTGTDAQTAIEKIDLALAALASQRANIGAGMNRLTYAADNLANVSQNSTDSRSRILDTDYATATTALSRTQIISQAATAMLAQANQQPQTVLQLLKG